MIKPLISKKNWQFFENQKAYFGIFFPRFEKKKKLIERISSTSNFVFQFSKEKSGKFESGINYL